MKEKIRSYVIIIVVIVAISIIIKKCRVKNETRVNQVEENITTNNYIKNYNYEELIEKIEIGDKIPRYINKILFKNYDTTSEEPITYEVNDEEKIYNFIKLLSNTYWEEDEGHSFYNGWYKNDGSIFYWTIELFGETKTTMKLCGYSSVDEGYVKVIDDNMECMYLIDKNCYIDIKSYMTKRYYLHKSDKENPTKEESLRVQKIFFSELEENKIDEIEEKVNTLHSVLENLLADGTKSLKEPASKYWSIYIDGKEITDPFSGVRFEFGEHYCFNYVINELEAILDIIQNKDAKEDLLKGLKVLEEGVEKHDIEKIFEAHEYIHDYDVWVVEYPIQGLIAEPIEWKKLSTYFGRVSELN